MSTRLLEQWREQRVVLLMMAVLCIALFMALRLPIYPDEVAYRIILERFFQSGGYKTSITPYCAEGFQVVPPHLLKISAVVWSSLGLIDSAIAYRVIPATLLIMSVGALYWYASRQGMRARPWFLVLFVPGVSIYGLVILRPEVFIAVSMAMLALLGLYIANEKKIRHNTPVYVAVCVTLLFILVSYVHPKALYLLLPALVVLGLTLEKVLRSITRTACVVGLVIVTLLTAYDAVEMHGLGYASCKDFPEVQASMNSLNVNIIDAYKNSSKFISNLSMANDEVRYNRTLSQLSFRPGYDIGVLPDVPAIWVVNFTIQAAVLATFAYVALIILLNAVQGAVNRTLERRFLVYLGISAAAGCQFFFNIPKNWYDISLSVFSLGILAFIGSGFGSQTPEIISARIRNKAANWLQSTIIVAALLSIGINYQFIYRPFADGYVGPGISSKTPLEKLKALAQTQYRIDYENVSQPIIIDDLTYHMFQGHNKTYPVTYLMLNAKSNPATIDVVLAGGDLIGITRCSLLIEFDAIRKTTLLSRTTFTAAPNFSEDICKWSVR